MAQGGKPKFEKDLFGYLQRITVSLESIATTLEQISTEGVKVVGQATYTYEDYDDTPPEDAVPGVIPLPEKPPND